MVPKDVEVPTVKDNEFNWVPPATLNPPLDVALAKVEAPEESDPSDVPPLTVNPVVVALPAEMLLNVERPETLRVPPRTVFWVTAKA